MQKIFPDFQKPCSRRVGRGVSFTNPQATRSGGRPIFLILHPERNEVKRKGCIILKYILKHFPNRWQWSKNLYERSEI